MKIRPLHDWAVIRRTDEGERTAGGIIIPSVAREKPAEGIVEAIGPGKYRTGEGKGKREKFIPTIVKSGQRVVFIDFKARNVEIDGQEVTLVREEDILGTYEEGKYPVRKESHPVSVKKEGPVLIREESRGKSAVAAASGGSTFEKKESKKKKTVKKSEKPSGRKRAKPEKKEMKGPKGAAKKTEKKSVRRIVKKTVGATARKSTPQKRRKTAPAKPASGTAGGRKKVRTIKSTHGKKGVSTKSRSKK